MPRLLPLLALSLCLLPAAASAQSLYKCRIDGVLTYSGAPCPGAASTPIEVPPAVPRAPDADSELARQKAQAARLQEQRQKKEAAQSRLDQARGRLAESQRQRCAKLRLQKKWADEGVAAASDRNRGQAAAKARRAQEALLLACPL